MNPALIFQLAVLYFISEYGKLYYLIRYVDFYIHELRSQDISVSIATGYRLDDFRKEKEIVLFFKASIQPPNQWITGTLSSG
jgi:hypothetical protein